MTDQYIKIIDDGEGEEIHPELIIADFLDVPEAYRIEKVTEWVNELVKALRPFAAAADAAESIKAIHNASDDVNYYVRLGDLRAARAALETKGAP